MLIARQPSSISLGHHNNGVSTLEMSLNLVTQPAADRLQTVGQAAITN
jgi:hypothetical protein